MATSVMTAMPTIQMGMPNARRDIPGMVAVAAASLR
jgi:hypothetical protein